MGKKRSWTVDQLIEAVKTAKSWRRLLGNLGLRQAGGNYDQIHKYVKEYNLSTKHFTGKAWNKGMRGIGKPRTPLEKILVKGSFFQSYKLRNRLFKEGLKPKHCEQCGWAEYSKDGRLPLELDHINSDRTDNRLSNLRILCPNCHSLTSQYRSRKDKKRI